MAAGAAGIAPGRRARGGVGAEAVASSDMAELLEVAASIRSICTAAGSDTDHRTAPGNCTASVLIIGLDWPFRTPFHRFLPKPRRAS